MANPSIVWPLNLCIIVMHDDVVGLIVLSSYDQLFQMQYR